MRINFYSQMKHHGDKNYNTKKKYKCEGNKLSWFKIQYTKE
jgi:hypothetical protein